MLDEPGGLREAALLGALHLAVAGVGRVVPTGDHAEILRAEFEPLVRERNPSVVVAAAGPVDLEIGFGTMPEASVPSLGAFLCGARIGILASETGARCEPCRTALEAALGRAGACFPALGPFLGALVATSALGRLIRFGGPNAIAFDLARAAAIEVAFRSHDCPARRRA